MPDPETIVIHLFHTKVGDLGIADETRPFFDIGAACDTTAERLEAYARDATYPDDAKPLRAQAVGADGHVLAEYEMGSDYAERIGAKTR